MANIIKKVIQDTLVAHETSKYMKEVEEQKKISIYDGWLIYDKMKKKEMINKIPFSGFSVRTVCFSDCKSKFSLKDYSEEIIVFYGENGELDSECEAYFSRAFNEYPDMKICYADEDMFEITDDKKKRCNPWIKPVWSEDTLLSYQYFGNVFAVKRECFENIEAFIFDDIDINVYDFLLKATSECKKNEIIHLELFLFSAIKSDKQYWGFEEKYNAIKGSMVPDEKTGFSYPVFEIENLPKVSIVIPSKDNVDILMQCISTVKKYTKYPNYEIIVVDNGSSEENKNRLTSLSQEVGFYYYHIPMDFNFSTMCNIGVEKSEGEYILLLNDDMEVVQRDWLTRMLGQAARENTGAVGAKLLYPNTTLIQHAGVGNSVDGPTHKLGKMDDSEVHYFGRNKMIYDMVAVTAACLLVSKKKYLEVEGLFEGLKVAFNDVDFCFKLLEAGYNNVQRNDVILYHHESLSRGNDLMDDKKIQRLLAERSVLYKRHPKLRRVDSYLGDMFNGGYPEFRMSSANDKIFYNEAAPKRRAALPDESTMNKMVFPQVESCKWDEDFECYVIKGYVYMPTLDNARFERKLLLVDKDGQVYELESKRFYREDIAVILKEVVNPDLNGFCVHIKKDALSKGDYDVWMYAKDKCSRQVLYSKTDDVLKVE